MTAFFQENCPQQKTIQKPAKTIIFITKRFFWELVSLVAMGLTEWKLRLYFRNNESIILTLSSCKNVYPTKKGWKMTLSEGCRTQWRRQFDKWWGHIHTFVFCTKEIHCAEHKYMKMSPSLIELATPMALVQQTIKFLCDYFWDNA